MLLDLATSIAAMNALVAKHPLLPADEITPSTRGISVHLHGGFADFEAWREALAVAPETVAFYTRHGGTTLRADTNFGGVPLTLVGYSGPVPEFVAQLKAVAA